MAPYLRGKGEREGWWRNVTSLRSLLTIVYSLAVDGGLGGDSLLRVKLALDDALKSGFADRETWGNDTSALDEVPPAASLDER